MEPRSGAVTSWTFPSELTAPCGALLKRVGDCTLRIVVTSTGMPVGCWGSWTSPACFTATVTATGTGWPGVAPLMRLAGDGVLPLADPSACMTLRSGCPPSCRRACGRRELGEFERCRASGVCRTVSVLTTIFRVGDCILLLNGASTTTLVGDCPELQRRTSGRDPLKVSGAPALDAVPRALIGADCCEAPGEPPGHNRVPLVLEGPNWLPRGLARGRVSAEVPAPELRPLWGRERCCCNAKDLRCGRAPPRPGDLRWAVPPFPAGLAPVWECLPLAGGRAGDSAWAPPTGGFCGDAALMAQSLLCSSDWFPARCGVRGVMMPTVWVRAVRH